MNFSDYHICLYIIISINQVVFKTNYNHGEIKVKTNLWTDLIDGIRRAQLISLNIKIEILIVLSHLSIYHKHIKKKKKN